MKFLIVSPFFHPEPISTGRYNTSVAQRLADLGHQVEVIAYHPLYPEWRPQRSVATLPGISIRRGGEQLRYPRSSMLRRVILETSFARFASRQAGPLLTGSVLVAVFPPSLFMAVLAGRSRRAARVVGIVHDLQGVHAGRGGGPFAALLRLLISCVEKRAFAACDHLVFLSRSMAERAIAEYGLDPADCSVRYPFVNLPPHSDFSATALESVLPSGEAHVVYSGALGDKQEPDRLVEFLERLARRRPDVRCHVFSGGPHFERLRDAYSERGAVRFRPLVAPSELPELYARSTVQILPQAPGTGDGSLPSKLPNLLASGVPVFAICDADSEIVHLIDEIGPQAGSTVAGFSAPDIDSRLDALLAGATTLSRAERIALQRPLIDRRFGMDALIADLCGEVRCDSALAVCSTRASRTD